MKKALIFFTLSLFFLASASAQSTVINVYIDSSGNALFLGATENPSVNLPGGITQNNGEITGTTSLLTNKIGEEWQFSLSVEDSELLVFMPEGSIITSVSPAAQIYLSGEQITIYSENSITVAYTIDPVEKERNNFLIYIAAILIILLILVVIARKRKPSSKKHIEKNQNTKIDYIKQVLNNREKLIIEKLKQTGKIKSSYLRKMCDIPKASFSRHLQELEKKGLITRSGEGKNKFVELKEN